MHGEHDPIYGPYRCTCEPGIQCQACEPQRTNQWPVKVLPPAHRHINYVRRVEQQKETTRAEMRQLAALWLTEHGRLPTISDLPVVTHDGPLGRLTRARVSRLFQSVERFWESCLDHGLCSPRDVTRAKKRQSIAMSRSNQRRKARGTLVHPAVKARYGRKGGRGHAAPTPTELEEVII